MDRRIITAACGVAIGGLATLASAAPYAAAVSEAGGNVTYTLNEAADNVTVIRDGVPTSLGALGLGSHTFARSGATNYSIQVSKNSGAGFLNAIDVTVGIPEIIDNTPTSTALQISDDANIRNSFFAPRGMAVNRNPANGALFGRIYVSNATVGTTSGSPTPVRTTGRGIYVNNPDGTDALGQGDTELTGGLTFAVNGFSPWRLALDDDSNLYISDQSDPNGSVYRTDMNVSAGTGTNLLVGVGGLPGIIPSNTQNHGGVSALLVRGGASSGNLVMHTIDEDLSADGSSNDLNSLWRYDLGSATAGFNGLPTQLAKQVLISNVPVNGIITDLARGPDGKFYLSQNRTDGNETGIAVVANDGVTVLYTSLADTMARGLDGNSGVDGVQDVFRRTWAIDISPDGQYMAIVRTNSAAFIVPLIDGIPDMPNRMYVPTFPLVANGREMAYDAAGNIYVLSSGNFALRAFSPGKVSLNTWNSNGTFTYHDEPEWFVTGGGNASTTANWLLGYRPNGKSEIALFGNSITAPATVTLDQATTLGTVKFNSSNKYTIAGPSTLTLDSFGEPRITVIQGSHDITAPVVSNGNLQMTAIPANSVLTMSNLTMTGGSTGSLTITTAGAGVVAANTFRAAALNVNSGTARVISNGTAAATSTVKALNIAGGLTPTAKLDVRNNAFVVDYDSPNPSPLPTIQAQIKAAYNGGGANAWTGNGITRSDGNAQNFAVGYAEASSLTSIPAIFGGSVDATAVLFRGTRYGDANLDGLVNLNDFNRLAGNFGQTNKVWFDGDFNYDSNVNLNDFNLLASNFGLAATGPDDPTPQDWANLAAAVPEPASIGVLAVAAAQLLIRRRRSCGNL